MKRRSETGTIWAKPPPERRQLVLAVCEALASAYGSPRHGNPADPVDDLVYIIASNRTAPGTAQFIYRSLKEKFVSWEDLPKSGAGELESILHPGGLAEVKSAQLRSALRKIEMDFGRCQLDDLRMMPTSQAESYLCSLPGVSLKVAKCVMMYTLGFAVLPVDVHVHRVTRRLGWIDWKRADQSHEELEALVPEDCRYNLHVDCLSHGRLICLASEPQCEICCVNRYCDFYKKHDGND